jgi:hypothetical protein
MTQTKEFLALELDFWNLEFVWDLVLGIWNFFILF